jgi:hypothetical protein
MGDGSGVGGVGVRWLRRTQPLFCFFADSVRIIGRRRSPDRTRDLELWDWRDLLRLDDPP